MVVDNVNDSYNQIEVLSVGKLKNRFHSSGLFLTMLKNLISVFSMIQGQIIFWQCSRRTRLR